MFDIILPIGVLGMMLAFAAQVRRLIEQAMLNRTIRKALEIDPASVPLLVERLGTRRIPDGLIGWMFTVSGIALAIASAFATGTDRLEGLQVSLVITAAGLGALGYAWWVQRQTLKR